MRNINECNDMFKATTDLLEFVVFKEWNFLRAIDN